MHELYHVNIRDSKVVKSPFPTLLGLLLLHIRNATESQKTSYDNVNASTFTHLLRYHQIKQQIQTLLPPLTAPRRIVYLQIPLGRAFLHLMQRRKNFDRPDLEDQDLAAREIFAA